ncbi:MAG: type IX secretion system sortase PorU [bacterium]|nr:type IX secretion system sortase PorU [bacterium]
MALPADAAAASGSIEFATQSRLASGRWAKVSVTSTGIHRLSPRQLRDMGFSDPSQVKVYGYGGARLSERLVADSVRDDLPQTPSLLTADGIVFYAEGPVSWTRVNKRAASNGEAERFNHVINPYTLKGYYFLTDSDSGERAGAIPSTVAAPTSASGAAVTFRERTVLHEEQNILGESGHSYFGHDLKANPVYNYSIPLPGLAAGTYNYKVWTNTAIGGRTTSDSRFSVEYPDGFGRSASVRLPASNDANRYDRGRTAASTNSSSTFEGGSLPLTLAFSGAGTVYSAYFFFTEVTYERELAMPGSSLCFRLSNSLGSLGGASAATQVWDVTDPINPVAVNTAMIGDRLVWRNSASDLREYVAFDPDGAYPEPAFEGLVANQNLHALPTPDLVIFTLADYTAQAETLAAHRRSQGLDVAVVDAEDVYREFGSGSPDVQTFRRFLRMLYDRGEEGKLKYALFFGRGIWDYRRISVDSRQGQCAGPALPTWQTLASTNQFQSSYMTDDIFGMLGDNSYVPEYRGTMQIAVGRLPVSSAAMATSAVNKLIAYDRTATGPWRSRLLMITDTSKDASVFMRDGDNAISAMRTSTPGGQLAGVGSGMLEQKVYLAAYPIDNGKTTVANREVQEALSEGVSWMAYIGHSSQTQWGDKGVMDFSYASGMSLRRKPVVVAATCEYAQFDGSIQCGAEAMWRNEQGPIAVITATRPAAISDNALFISAITRYIGAVDSNGRRYTVGDVMRLAKNQLAEKGTGRINAYVYVLVGDPSMPALSPSLGVKVTEMVDVTTGKTLKLDGTPPPYIPGGARVTFRGEVVSALDASKIDDFNGEVSLTLFDAMYDRSSLCLEDNKDFSFSVQGGTLTMARAAVAGGEWEATLQVPLEIANNNTPAALSMYAVENGTSRDAMGTSREFTVSGFTDVAPDSEPPVINSLYLNYPGFKNGDTVDASPTLYASVADNVSVNLSSSGVGRGITLTLDDGRTFGDLPSYFTPDFGACTSGSIAYPLHDLPAGEHWLKLTVWDTSDNLAEASLAFWVDDAAAPSIVDVYTDANPASVSANFYVTHDRPDKDVNIGIEIFDIAGRRIWTREHKSYSEGNVAEPITWDLTTGAGSRVSSGIYLYRATLSMPGGETYSSRSRKLAVTPR